MEITSQILLRPFTTSKTWANLLGQNVRKCFFNTSFKLNFIVSYPGICDYNGTRTHNHLVCKRTLNHVAKLASLAKWLSVRLRAKHLWVRVPLQSLKLQI